MSNNYPKLHNAAWPGVVGKGDDSEPPIDLDTMLDLTAAADVGGVKFDGFDLFLSDPHISIDSGDDELKALADKASSRGLAIGSVVAPVWEPTGGGSAMGSDAEREAFLTQVRKACGIARKLREIGVVTATCVLCFSARAAAVIAEAVVLETNKQKGGFLDKTHPKTPAADVAYYVACELFPAATALFVLRKLPPLGEASARRDDPPRVFRGDENA